MAQIELIMPKMGESVAEATIIKWLKQEGDKIAIDETVLEIATDKVDSEIPSPSEGILVKKLFQEGEVVQVGTAIALIASGAEETISSLAPASSAPKETIEKKEVSLESVSKESQKANAPIERISSTGRFYSPLVRNIAKEEGISMAELEKIPGTGRDGRLTKNDLLAYVPLHQINGNNLKEQRPSSPIEKSLKSFHTEPSNGTHKPSVWMGPNDEIIEMDRMRKLIAEHMLMSKHTSPHVTSFVEADVTNIVLWREKIKHGFEKRENEKLTYTPLFIEAVVKSIKDFPMVNVSIDGNKIILRKNINIGMAAALPSGNLIVPVIKNADHKNLLGLTKEVNDLAKRARNNKLQPDEIQGGTFTLTNVGTFGNLMGTPIINQPQVAILATGSIKKKPAVIESPHGDTIGIRHFMYLSLSYDHRVVDGALGGSFLKRIADYLEQFDVNRTV